MGFRVNLDEKERFFESKPFTAQTLKVFPDTYETGERNSMTVSLNGGETTCCIDTISVDQGAIVVFVRDGCLQLVIDGKRVLHVEVDLKK